jgi:hypothetical protein
MSKDSVAISLSASVLVDAQKHVLKFPSKADDSGSADRTAMHYLARVLNHSDMELEGTQAAGIVLGQKSSGASASIEYVWAWDFVKLSRTHSEDEPDKHDDDCEADDGLNDDEIDEVLFQDPAGYAVDGDPVPNVHAARAEVRKELDLLQPKSNSRQGQAGIYKSSDDTLIPVSPAEHFCVYLSIATTECFKAHQLARCMLVRHPVHRGPGSSIRALWSSVSLTGSPLFQLTAPPLIAHQFRLVHCQ